MCPNPTITILNISAVNATLSVRSCTIADPSIVMLEVCNFTLIAAYRAYTKVVAGGKVFPARYLHFADGAAVDALVPIGPIAVGMASCRNHFYLVRAAEKAGVGITAIGGAGSGNRGKCNDGRIKRPGVFLFHFATIQASEPVIIIVTLYNTIGKIFK